MFVQLYLKTVSHSVTGKGGGSILTIFNVTRFVDGLSQIITIISNNL